MALAPALSVLVYVGFLGYTLVMENAVYRSSGSVFQLWIDWPYFALFGSLLTTLCCAVVYGSNMTQNMTSLMLLQIAVCGIYQFEANAYDWHGRPNYFIHFVNHEVLGKAYSMQCDEYPVTQSHLYIFNVLMVWIQMPLCTLISASYPVLSLSIVTVGSMFCVTNAFTYCISAVFHGIKYAPGMLSALFLVFPYCVWMISMMIRNDIIHKSDLGLVVIAGIAVHIPVVAVLSLSVKQIEWIGNTENALIYAVTLAAINVMFFLGFSAKRNIKID